jgi:hypothetical protein
VTAAAAGAPVLVDATGTRRRLQALVAIGWHRTELARRLHLGPSQFKALLRRRCRVAAEAAAAVEALYDRIWDQRPRGSPRGTGAQVCGRARLARAHGLGRGRPRRPGRRARSWLAAPGPCDVARR